MSLVEEYLQAPMAEERGEVSDKWRVPLARAMLGVAGIKETRLEWSERPENPEERDEMLGGASRRAGGPEAGRRWCSRCPAYLLAQEQLDIVLIACKHEVAWCCAAVLMTPVQRHPGNCPISSHRLITHGVVCCGEWSAQARASLSQNDQ